MVCEVCIGSFNKEMIMIVHQTIGVAESIIADGNKMEDIEKYLTVVIIAKHCLFFISPAGSMIYSSAILYSYWTCHTQNISMQKPNVKKIDLPPFCC